MVFDSDAPWKLFFATMKLEKITECRRPAPRRYEDACAAAHALDLVGERWALLVMRELMLGRSASATCAPSLPGISANVLTQRLEGLEAAGVLVRRRLPPPAASQVYELTRWGYESEPIFQALGRWAARSPSHDPALPFSAASLLLSLRTMLDPARAEGHRGADRLPARRRDLSRPSGRWPDRDRRRPLDGAELIFTGPPPVLAAAIYGGQPLAALEARARCGSRATARSPAGSSRCSRCRPRQGGRGLHVWSSKLFPIRCPHLTSLL